VKIRRAKKIAFIDAYFWGAYGEACLDYVKII
jgi:hypothetical protein